MAGTEKIKERKQVTHLVPFRAHSAETDKVFDVDVLWR
jgi:hypothetical protein